MRKQIIYLFLTVIATGFIVDNEEIQFSYPKDKSVKFYMKTDFFEKFKKEWRGSDYYYMCDNGKDGIICSVLFFKLTEEEKLMYIDLVRAMYKTKMPEKSPAYPTSYFKTHSNLAKFEINDTSWTNADSAFMSRQVDIKEFNGVKVSQKHMYSYAMFGKDIFVNIHLSKTDCTPSDSIHMRQILEGLHK